MGVIETPSLLKLDDGVEIVDGDTVAVSLPVWLLLDVPGSIKSGRWIRLRYRGSLLDDNVRPLIRFMDKEGTTIILPMNGMLFGTGEWIGYIPDGTLTISISPVSHTGSFSFQVEKFEYISVGHLIRRGLLRDPLAVAWSAQAWLRHAHDAARRGLKIAGSSTQLNRYNDWQRARSRPPDLVGIDKPRDDWDSAPVCHLIVEADSQVYTPLQTTVRSLLAQLYPHWTLTCLINPNRETRRPQDIRTALGDDPRISVVVDDQDWLTIAAHAEHNLCTVITAGDLLLDYSLAVLAAAATREPLTSVFYGDEDSISLDGKLHTPVLRPDWSPQFQAMSGYMGRCVWLRARHVIRHGGTGAQTYVAQYDHIVHDTLAECDNSDVRHIRRILYRRRREPDAAFNSQRRTFRSPLHSCNPAIEQLPEAVVIVPSRDNADLLATCIYGLLKKTDYSNLRITVVDNGSVKSDALALLRDLKTCAKVDILERSGPFNYSAMCNDAAAASKAPLLVFLNDDTAIINANWLKPMVLWATQQQVGVVGAKLLFPSGRIQHAGVVVGMGGIAAHLYHNKEANQAGYLNRLTVAQEVTAVTAACIAIERRKFVAIGGFDAIHFPVELNDIDLCLRLSEQGLSTIWTPESVLIHHEAASRGATWSGNAYKAERAYFIERWQDAIRDDHYFHPDLSLFSHTPALA